MELRSVALAGVPMRISSSDRRKIVVRAPRNAARGTVAVTNSGGVGFSPRVVVVKPSVQLIPGESTPGASVAVSGAGFIPGEPIDIFFGRTPVDGVYSADDAGLLPGTTFSIPATATPGIHVVRLQGRFSGVPVDAAHSITVPWLQRGFGADGVRHNRYENQLTSRTAEALELRWVADAIGPDTILAGRVWRASVRRLRHGRSAGGQRRLCDWRGQLSYGGDRGDRRRRSVVASRGRWPGLRRLAGRGCVCIHGGLRGGPAALCPGLDGRDGRLHQLVARGRRRTSLHRFR